MLSGVDSRKFNVDGTAGLFQCPVFFPSVLGSAIPHNPRVIRRYWRFLSWTELSIITVRHWTSLNFAVFEDLRVNICTDDQILAGAASFISREPSSRFRAGGMVGAPRAISYRETFRPTSTHICAGSLANGVRRSHRRGSEDRGWDRIFDQTSRGGRVAP